MLIRDCWSSAIEERTRATTRAPRKHAISRAMRRPLAAIRCQQAIRAVAACCLAVIFWVAAAPIAKASDAMPPPERWRPIQSERAVGALILLSGSNAAIAPEQGAIARGMGAEVARQGGHAILYSGLPTAADEAALVVIDRLARELVAEIENARGAGSGRYVIIAVGSLSDGLLRRRLAGTEPKIAAGVPMLLIDPACSAVHPAAAPTGLTLLQQNYYNAGRHPETRDCQQLDRELRNRGFRTRFQYSWEVQRPRGGREQGWALDVRALFNAIVQ